MAEKEIEKNEVNTPEKEPVEKQGKTHQTRNRGQNQNRSRGFGRATQEKEFEEKVIKISRITKVVKGGKRMRFSALVVIGDGKGRYGYGLGKSTEVPEAIKKGMASARKNLNQIEITKEGSINHLIIGKFGATEVFLKPAPVGTGLIAGGAVRAVLELAGVKNVYSKIYGSRTQTNVVKATMDGLSKLKTYSGVASLRYGKVTTPSTETSAENN